MIIFYIINNGPYYTTESAINAGLIDSTMYKDDFEEYIYKYIDDINCRLSDDVLLSNYYHKKKVNIKILNVRDSYSIIDMWSNKCILEYGNQADALHNGAGGISENNINRYKKVIAVLNKNKDRYFKLKFILNHKIVLR